MESKIITPQEQVNLANAVIKTIRSTSDETLLELGLVTHDNIDAIATFTIVNKYKWFLAKIKYGI
jgi:hypothetical protein